MSYFSCDWLFRVLSFLLFYYTAAVFGLDNLGSLFFLVFRVYCFLFLVFLPCPVFKLGSAVSRHPPVSTSLDKLSVHI